MATGAVLVAGATLTAGTLTATAAMAATTGPQARTTNVLNAGPGTRVQQDVLSIVNEQRRVQGCPDLWLDDRLMDAARSHAAEMANHVYFDHESLAGETAGERVEETGYDWWSYAENIARGQDSPHEVVQDWMDSPPHRDNILNCSLREVGVGLAFDTDNTPYWVQDFATES